MARLASESKGGFYPTPENQLKLILPHLHIRQSIEQSLINAIDPCAGEGKALRILVEHLQTDGADVHSYGIELEQTRAEEAKQRLQHVLHDGYESIRTEPKYSVMWLNPPYAEVFKERTELRFLRTLSSKSKGVLIPDGLLMFCIPQHVLGSVATVLTSRFRELKVYRFTDEEYSIFKQVVVFGYAGRAKQEERKAMQQQLKEWAKAGPEALPTLEEITDTFEIPPSPEPISIFRGGKLREDELRQDLLDSQALVDFQKKVQADIQQTKMKNPLLPLKVTHAGIAVASGAIGGNFGNHIVVGLTKQVTEKEDIEDDEGLTSKEIYTKHFRSIVRVFTQNGIFELE